MKLNKVTITGIDETVNKPISEVVKITEEFTFIEWGILFSKNNQGSKLRYPSIDFITYLIGIINNSDKFSAHICGEYVRDLLLGVNNLPSIVFDNFSRVQLNFNSLSTKVDEVSFIQLLKKDFQNKEIIFQLRGDISDNLFYQLCKEFHNSSIKISGLYDKSGGTGKSIDTLPNFTSIYNNNFGYAGGINPDNIEEVINSINKLPSNDNYWIDMESGVRTDNIFDLDKVIKCLEVSKKFIYG